MQPTVLDNVKVDGDLGGQKVAMTIDHNALAHIMGILTDLYSDPEMAVIREYSTNAFDAHVEAGQKRPIEITTPSPLSPYFKVKDYGVGMSKDDIINIYSLYGASTKRDTNTQVGMLGLGCKSALTYTPQFNLIAVKNGMKVNVSVSRAADGTGEMEIVDERPTMEHPGVEIVIPVKVNNRIEKKCAEFFRFWQRGNVLVNGKAPASIFDMPGAKIVSKNTVMVPGLSYDFVVMGNVAYPADNHIRKNVGGYGTAVVGFVEIGEVNFTPSREQLHYTNLTKQTLARVSQEFKSALEKAVADDLDKSANATQAFLNARIWRENLGNGINYVYKGMSIPVTLRHSKYYDYIVNRARSACQYHGYEGFVVGSNEKLEQIIFVHGFDGTEVNGRNREKMRYYANLKGIDFRRAIIVKDKFGTPWLDDAHWVSWDDIKAIKIPRVRTTQNGPSVPRERYEVITQGTVQMTSTLTGPLVYFSPADTHDVGFQMMCQQFGEGVTLVSLSRNRWDKFKRDYPHAIYLNDHVRKLLEKAKGSLTHSDKMLMTLDSSRITFYGRLDETEFDDPEIKDFITACRAVDGTKSTAYNGYIALRNAARYIGVGAAEVEAVANPFANYPLVHQNSAALRYNETKQHAIIYMNAVYQQTKEKK